MDNITVLEATHFRGTSQAVLDFSLDAKTAHEGDQPPPELVALNRGVRPS